MNRTSCCCDSRRRHDAAAAVGCPLPGSVHLPAPPSTYRNRCRHRPPSSSLSTIDCTNIQQQRQQQSKRALSDNNQFNEWYGIVALLNDIADNDPDDARRILSRSRRRPHRPWQQHRQPTTPQSVLSGEMADARPGILRKPKLGPLDGDSSFF
jgi:hypothetical protein